MQTDSRTAHTSLAFIAIASAFAINMAGTTLPTAVYHAYQRAYGYKPAVITAIYAIYSLGVLGTLLVAGNWSDQLGRKRMLMCGLAISGASALVFIASSSIPCLMAARVLSGVSAGIFAGTATVAIIESAPARRRNAATLAATASNMLGLGSGPVLGGILVQWLPAPTRIPYAVHLGLICIAAFLIGKIPETVNVPAQPRLRVQHISLPREVRGPFMSAALAGFSGFVVVGFFAAVSPQLMRIAFGFHSDLATGFVVFLLFAASALGQALQGRLVPSWRLPAGCICLIAGLLMVAASVVIHSSGTLVAGAVLAGLGQGASFRAGLGDITSRSPPHTRAGVTSAYFVALYVALSLPVVGLGIVEQLYDIQRAALLFSMCTIVLVMISLCLLLRFRTAQESGAASTGTLR
jgi:MFS family permease